MLLFHIYIIYHQGFRKANMICLSSTNGNLGIAYFLIQSLIILWKNTHITYYYIKDDDMY